MAEKSYSRVYHSIIDDPKFVGIYDDDRRLATWLRLLIAAEQAYPASAYIPEGTSRPALTALVDCGLVDIGTGRRFRIHGLASERDMRAHSARNAAAVRWHSGRNAEPMLDENETRTRQGIQGRRVNGASAERLVDPVE